MKHSIIRLAFAVLIGNSLSACETTKVTELPANNTPVAAETKSAATGAPTKTANETAPSNATASAPIVKAAEPVVPAVVKPEQLYAEGKDLYEKGDYRGAIRKLTSARDASDDVLLIKQNSLKYLAFSYCVTSQRPLCKAQFSSLLKLTPNFELSRGEAGHPLWGPVFKEAKAGALKSSK
jgi:hypothetical protein